MVKKGYYRHFKGGIYKVIGSALNVELNEQMVLYTDISNNVYVRPEFMFLEEISVPDSFFLEPRFSPLMKTVIKTDFGYIGESHIRGGTNFFGIEDAQYFADNKEYLDSLLEKYSIINAVAEQTHAIK